jgi:hypothetical protein
MSAVKVTRWRKEVEAVVVDVLNSQPHFSEVSWDTTIDFRLIAPNQPPMAVFHIIFVVPSVMLGNPPLVSAMGIPLMAQPPKDRLKDQISQFLMQISQANAQQLAEKPVMHINNGHSPETPNPFPINGRA